MLDSNFLAAIGVFSINSPPLATSTMLVVTSVIRTKVIEILGHLVMGRTRGLVVELHELV